MLMEIRQRKGWIKGVFVLLILVFAAGFVIGGVGSGTPYSLSDIIGQGGGGASTNPTDIKGLEKETAAHPKRTQAWVDLGRAYAAANRPLDEITAYEHAAQL